jgi:hypothetical protein
LPFSSSSSAQLQTFEAIEIIMTMLFLAHRNIPTAETLTCSQDLSNRSAPVSATRHFVTQKVAQFCPQNRPKWSLCLKELLPKEFSSQISEF